MKHATLYKIIKSSIILCGYLLCSKELLAQEKKLKTVEINHYQNKHKKLKDERFNSFAPGTKIEAIDSAVLEQYKMQHLAQLLAQHIPVFIKSYGINSLATLNFRGSSSAQSQVLWNGVPLNNASLGIADISMLGVGNFDDVSIAYGGSSALSGSGNVGAAILLNSRFEVADTQKHWHTKLATEVGSFGQRKLLLQEQYQSSRFYISGKLFGQKVQNDFSFQNNKGFTQKMPNADLRSYSAMIDFGYQIAARTELQISAWQQQFDREIPPALFENFSSKRQSDKAFRLFAAINHRQKNGALFYSKSAFFTEQMRFDDDSIAMHSKNKNYQFYEEIGWKKQLNQRHELIVFLPVQISFTKPQFDNQYRFQNKIALATSYRYQTLNGRLSTALNVRAEQINDKTIALTGANAAYYLLPSFKLRANIQRSYRAPTLNEWYYSPGGNPNLLPESGWSEDAGYELLLRLSAKWKLQHEASFFNREISNWILWFGGSIWTPHNIAKVHSRGVETNSKLIFKSGKWQAQLGFNSSYVLATTKESYIPNDGSIGKQIPYSPRYNVQGLLSIVYGHFSFDYNHSYIGYRFVTTDESEYIKPYHTGNAYMSYTQQFKNIHYRLSLQCMNLLNARYEVVNARPMPLRHWAIGVGFEF